MDAWTKGVIKHSVGRRNFKIQSTPIELAH
jgi:hypothetical protein